MTELTRNDLDNHDWAARASEALAQAKRLPPGSMRSEAIRKAGQLRFAADMKYFLSPKSQRRDESDWLTAIQSIGRVSNPESRIAALCRPQADLRSALQNRGPWRETARRSAFCQIPSKGPQAEPTSTDHRVASHTLEKLRLVGRPHVGRLMAESYSPSRDPLIAGQHPHCPNCDARMRLARVAQAIRLRRPHI